MKTERREPVAPKRPRLILADGTEPYGLESPLPDEVPTVRRRAVVAPERHENGAPPSAGRYSHVYGRSRDER